jgi:hypothetical protein
MTTIAPGSARKTAADGSSPPRAPVTSPVLLALASLIVVLLASYRINDYDVWQHLLVGKVIWQTHAPPTTHLWSWPSYGKPDLNSSWGFEALLYPFYAVAGIPGVFLWRCATALGAFALAMLGARAMGAQGPAAILVCVIASIAARDRMEARPETLSALLLGAFVWTLERRRNGPKDGKGDATAWLPLLSLMWANVHLSWFLGPALVALHAGEDTWRRLSPPKRVPASRKGRLVAATESHPSSASSPSRLWLILVACIAISFLNPFGWRALWEPFDFFLHRRHELIYRTILELNPPDFRESWREMVPLALLLWPALFAWRSWRGRWDGVELVLLVGFSVLAWRASRFVGTYAVVMAPYAARAASEWVAEGPRRGRPWAAGMRSTPVVAALIVVLAVPTLSRTHPPVGIGVMPDVRFDGVCDFIEREHLQGRMFNQFETGGYLLWRLWPGRLPFTDVHQAGTPEDMDLYLRGTLFEPAWRRLEEKFRFDYAVVKRGGSSDSLIAILGRDTTWTRAFADGQALLYVKRRPR